MTTKFFSSKQERMVADFLGWSVVSGSGARDCHPGDITSDEWLGECKTHEKPGHRIVFWTKVWNKICDEAASKHRYPILIVDDGSQKLDNTWVMFNLKTAGLMNVNQIDVTSNFLKTTSVSLKPYEATNLDTNIRSSRPLAIPVVRIGKQLVGLLRLDLFKEIVLDKGLL